MKLLKLISNVDYEPYLEKGKPYTVEEHTNLGVVTKSYIMKMPGFFGGIWYTKLEYFVTLEQWREQQINDLLNG
jgi:hypothetical protein